MRGLLDRVTAPRPELAVDPLESVLENLTEVFNSERGGSVSAPELGLSFYAFMDRWPDSVRELCDDIRAVVERFEPRLNNVEVQLRETADARRLSVIITADFNAESVRLVSVLPSCGGVHFEAVRKIGLK